MLSKPKIGYILANFGGPRSLDEVHPFLKTLLTDPDVIRNPYLPKVMQRWIFRYVAWKRTHKVSEDYQKIGGKSPIYEDTENLALAVKKLLEAPLITFHRYLPETHQNFIKAVKQINCDEIRVFPLFPQFTYATTGSIARWFDHKLDQQTKNKLRWVKSYSAHPAFLQAHVNLIRSFLAEKSLNHNNTLLLFSAHGVPQDFVDQGDPYERECRDSFHSIMQQFPNMLGRLAYQSKFGRGEWIKPYTIDVCKNIKDWHQGKSHVVFVPISFTSDHIETLFEVEQEYMTVIREQGLTAHRIPGLTMHPDWIKAIIDILKGTDLCPNKMLIRQ